MDEAEPGPGAGRGGRGRPPVVTEEQVESACNAIKMGAYIETACVWADIPKSLLYAYVKEANEVIAAQLVAKKPPKLTLRQERALHFRDALEKAMAESEVMDLTIITAAAANIWQAAAWRLERRFPDRWALKGERESADRRSLTSQVEKGAEQAADDATVIVVDLGAVPRTAQQKRLAPGPQVIDVTPSKPRLVKKPNGKPTNGKK